MVARGEEIAIVGCGLRFPGGANTPSKLWDLVHNPRHLAESIPPDRFSAQGYYHENGEYHGHGNVKEAYFLGGEGVHRRFDALFFGINPVEASVIDPQVRLLLETVYEALEAAGHTIEGLRGSDTAVYAGQMVADYEQVLVRDLDSMGTYHATGTSRALLSNRISYFFGWHGPSMTIDTACSSSLVAVHQAVQQLRSGQSRVAIAAGANLIFDPHCFVAESTLHMLSPDGRSRMWDAGANGYARGEGIAAVVLKTLSAAKADGDHIECIIRETGINQDGKTHGITMPNPIAQAQLIRDCYARSGLDLSNPEHRPQYFEAHGTGTPAGDPVEAEAVSSAFFPNYEEAHKEFDRLYVGSIKTLIGHTEGTAGLAGILKASLALQNSIIPPNLLLKKLNPRIRPFYANLQVPTQAVQWPIVLSGGRRRASVNSFGFGGTNAHAILESYTPAQCQVPGMLVAFAPFVFSAASESSLRAYLLKFHNYVRANDDINLRDIAYTLYARRTLHQVATTVSARSADELCTKLDQKLQAAQSDPGEALGTRTLHQSPDAGSPSILGVFTGQGAQWAQMGSDLITSSPFVRHILEQLEARLSQLPQTDIPSWSLLEELQKGASSSRIGEAPIAQPLCTAVQILQVELLRAAGIEFTAVVGHSSGEIAAAYAAGFISAEDAICIAYYRGLHSGLACGPRGQPGAMMAVGTSAEDAQELFDFPEFKGRACVAAINSPASVTLSGDRDAIEELKIIFEDEEKFARILKVDKAYHSHHMVACSDAYLESLAGLDIQVGRGRHSVWFSSVDGGDISGTSELLKGRYWDSNMVSPVLFMDAVKNACASRGPFNLTIEVGPHPVLKGPVLQILPDTDTPVQTYPYTGLFNRGSSAVQSFADGLGYVLTHLGRGSVNLHDYDQSVSGKSTFRLVKGLPTYAWNHDNEYWHEPRYARAVRMRPGPVHQLLGHMTPDSSEQDMRWRHLLRPTEVPWLAGHQLQCQIVFPAAGYVVMALEAAMILCQGLPPTLIEVLNIDIGRALTFDSDTSGVETIFSITDVLRQGVSTVEAGFKCNAALGKDADKLELLASGRVQITLGEPSMSALPKRPPQPPNLIKLHANKFYSALQKLGYQYTGPFSALEMLGRKLGAATGRISNLEPSGLILHPAVLDAAFQSTLLTYAAPGDGRLSSLHVPRRIGSVTVNPGLCAREMVNGTEPLPFDAVLSSQGDKGIVAADIDIYPSGLDHAMIQVQGLECVPFVRETAQDDKELFSTVVWDVAAPDVQFANHDEFENLPAQDELGRLLERMAAFYLRNLEKGVPTDHPSRVEGPYQHWFHFASNSISRARAGELPFWQPEWEEDTHERVAVACEPYAHVIDVRFLKAIGEDIVEIATGAKSSIEIGMRDDLLGQYYSNGHGLAAYTGFLARTVKQIVHRYPRMNILEIGAGTGACTKAIFQEIAGTFSSYTFTDISPGFSDAAKAWPEFNFEKMLFKTFDVVQDPGSQDLAEQSYDLVVASLVLHATPSLEQTLRNTRRLLKPGGHLIVLELLPTNFIHYGVMFGAFSGWWLGAQEGRVLTPAVAEAEWNDLLLKTGFSGCETTSPEVPHIMTPIVVFASQAVDDRIRFLRKPLSSVPQLFRSGTAIQDLVIVGGDGPRTSVLVDQLKPLLGQYCGNIRTIYSLPDLSYAGISSTSTVFSLADLDEPVFKQLDDPKWDAIKGILQEAGTLVWVTQGRYADNPHSSLLVGLARSAVREIPSLDYLFLDIECDRDTNAHNLAEAFLRHKAATQWRAQESISITVEPELVLDKGGRFLIPRLLPCKEMNDRYNSLKRLITAPSSSGSIRIVAFDSGYVLEQEPPTSRFDRIGLRIQVSHSLLSAVRVAESGCMFLILGKDCNSGDQVVALSTEHTSVANPWGDLFVAVKTEPGTEARFLSLMAYHWLASLILSGLSQGDRIVVHEPDHRLAAVLSAEAKLIGVETTFTTHKNAIEFGDVNWQTIHRHASDRTISGLLSKITVFLDFANSAGKRSIANRVRSQLPVYCRQERLDTLFGKESWTPRAPHLEEVRVRLETTATRACHALSQAGVLRQDICSESVTLKALSELKDEVTPCTVIDWTSTSGVLTKVKPAASLITFSKERTYWLAGLTGGLGLSLCEWMIRHGARNVVISSRKPKIDVSWLEEMRALRAVVKIASCDITKKEEVMLLHADICSSMPPIAGVAQGAMVLEDTPIRDMTLDALLNVTKPKRRRRGLAASVMHIGPIFGIGYIAQALDETTIFADATMRSGGYTATSEYDFHQLFAEAVLSGRPGSSAPVEILTGLQKANPSLGDLPVWESDPIMGHFIRHRELHEPATSDAAKIPVKTRLAEAQSQDQIYSIIQEAFYAKARALFQIDSGNGSDTDLASMRFDQIGIDSLSAVEIRSWFMKTLEVNIPVLRILNGVTVGELIAIACETIPSRMVPNLEDSSSVEDVGSRDLTSLPRTADSSDTQDGTPHSTSDSGSSSVESDVEFFDEKQLTASSDSAIQKFSRLSFSQEMFWFVWEFLQDKTSLNHTGWARMTGEVRVAELQNAVRAMGQQHESLRACFFERDGKPVQGIMENSVLELEFRHIHEEEEVSRTTEALRNDTFDVARGKTMRLVLLSRSPTEYFLVFGIHPLAMDGLSFQIFLDQLMDHYAHTHLKRSTRQFLEYSEKQYADLEAGNFDRELRFWRAKLATLPPPLPILSLSTAVSRPDLAAYQNERAILRIDVKTKMQIQAVCRHYRATPFHFYLASFRALLLRYATDAEDVSIGIGDANRTEDEMMDVIGPFINLLPVRLRTEASAKFELLLQDARTETYAALANSNVPFQVLLSKQGQREKTSWGNVHMQFEAFESSKLAYDVALDIVDDPNGECVHILEVRKELYGKAGAERLVKSYERLVKAFAAQPGLALNEPGIFEPAEIEEVIRFSQGPSYSSQWPRTVVHRIDEVALLRQHEPAVRHHDNTTILYATLSNQANAIAAALQAAGTRPGSAVAVLQEATHNWISSILGIWRSGAVYLPLDLGLPWARLAAIVQDCQPDVVLVDEYTGQDIDRLGKPGIKVIDVSTLACKMPQVPISAQAEGTAVILYTSGSTGTPKGILLKHEGLRNWAEAIAHLFNLQTEIVLQQTSSTFDLSLIQILTALCYGGSLCLLPWRQRGDAIAVSEIMAKHNVTFTCATPSEYSSWFNYGRQGLLQCTEWRTAFCAGESIAESLPGQLSSLGKSELRFCNLYGPSETSLAATAMQVPLPSGEDQALDVSRPIAAGRPLPNYSVYVVDAQLRPVPAGVQGEIYIGGAGVGPGYLNKTELTAERFVPNVFASGDDRERGWTTLHRTGDLGRWRKAGTLLIESRIAGDSQVKLRGLRIDLSEVEHAIIIAAKGALSEAVVSVRRSSPESPAFLIAHVVFDQASRDDDLSQHISAILSRLENLPQYMRPAALVPVDHLPKMNSAKLDRKAVAALPLPESARVECFENPTELTATEIRLRSIWEEVITDQPSAAHGRLIMPETDFFRVGGSSLLLLRLQARIREVLSVEIPIIRMFGYSTLAAMARRIDDSNKQQPTVEIDWDKETEISLNLLDLPAPAPVTTQGDKAVGAKVVVLTGATGHLGRALLNALVADSNVKRIHCIGVRNATSRHDLFALEKVSLHEGDLALPRLGLSKQEAERVFAEADVIIHNGAEVSYLKTYASLRACNLQSTKELVEMCAPHPVPIHYISTVSVGHVVAEAGKTTANSCDPDSPRQKDFVFSPVSTAAYKPVLHSSGDGSANTAHGYIASKWASERFLERLNERYSHWPIWIHRPSLIVRQHTEAGDAPGLELVENIRHYSALMQAIPVVAGGRLSGVLNLVPLHVVVKSILDVALGEEYSEQKARRVHFLHHLGDEELRLEDLRKWAMVGGVREDQGQVREVEEIELAEWALRAAELGMNATLVAMMERFAAARGRIVVPRVVR
ncbi:hypothetical protein DL768_006463 [Monosporascus sp. mg162]|nr:hypothetical protein DL768_006463 [Monosporascus sp. mg162]